MHEEPKFSNRGNSLHIALRSSIDRSNIDVAAWTEFGDDPTSSGFTYHTLNRGQIDTLIGPIINQLNILADPHRRILLCVDERRFIEKEIGANLASMVKISRNDWSVLLDKLHDHSIEKNKLLLASRRRPDPSSMSIGFTGIDLHIHATPDFHQYPWELIFLQSPRVGARPKWMADSYHPAIHSTLVRHVIPICSQSLEEYWRGFSGRPVSIGASRSDQDSFAKWKHLLLFQPDMVSNVGHEGPQWQKWHDKNTDLSKRLQPIEITIPNRSHCLPQLIRSEIEKTKKGTPLAGMTVIGHGQVTNNHQCIVVQSAATNSSVEFRPEHLVDAITTKPLKFVLLKACSSAGSCHPDDHMPFDESVAGKILQKQVSRHVIGMQAPICIRAMHYFLRSLVERQSLRNGLDIDLAVSAARRSLYSTLDLLGVQGSNRSMPRYQSCNDWWVPVHYANTRQMECLCP